MADKKKAVPKKKEVAVEWGEIFSWQKILIIISVLILVSFFAYHFGFLKKTCQTDECFQDSLEKCTPSKYIKLQNLNYYKYSVIGQRDDTCLIEIDLKKMAEGTPLDKKILFEGKGMRCNIPLNKIGEVQSENLEGILNYCSGPLKEAMYELIIQKLYTIIIANLGDVIGEIEDTLAGEV